MLRRHRLVGHRQARVVDLLQVVDHVDRAEHVVAIGRAAAAVEVMDETTEPARADREIGMHLVFGRPKTHVGKSHRHALRPIGAEVVLPHLGNRLPAERPRDLDQAGRLVHLAAETFQIAERFGRIDLDSRPLQDRLGGLVDLLHLRGGQDAEGLHERLSQA